MARPFQPYEPELQKLSSNTESPMSPVPRGETPVSFKPNVNRAKTKRWVEAKKYSYDGNDWGDDEYGEYDDDEPPPVPQHNLNQSTGDLPSMFTRDVSRPPLPSMDRSRSMDQVATLGGDSVRAQPAGPVEPATRTVPIVRPVDIYKRMRSEGAVPQDRSGAQSSAGPSNAAATATATIPGLTSAELHFPSSNEAPAVTGDYKPFRPQGAVDGGQDAQALQLSHPAEAAGGSAPTIQLPDVERLSSFAPDFSGDSYFSASEAQGPEPEQHQLQHNPSMGFRSVVHQAFDVPDTPSTTVDSVARSNSDSTSVISPIIPQRSQSDIKTPTILEEPGERTPPPKDASDTLVFKPGHRRDISLPSPNNSPSRTPRITNVQSAHPSAAGEMSVETPVASSFDSRSGEQTPQEALVHDAASGPDHPAPLSIGSHPVTSAPTLTHDGVPIIIPSMSTDNSPQDTESDRLRKEIMRTLSRETTPSKEQEEEEPASRPEAERQDSLIPSEYERYWSAAESTTSPVALDQATPDYVASPVALQGSTIQDLPPAASEPITSPATESSKPKLARRFSWESSSSSEEPAPAAGVQSPPAPMPGQFPVSRETPVQPSPAPEMTSPTAAEAIPAEAIPAQTVTSEEEPLNKTPEESDSSVGPETEKPKLTILPPVPDDRSTISDGQLPEVYHAEAIPNSYADTTQDNNAPAFSGEYNQHQQIPRWTPTAPASVEPTLLGFREILAMKTPEDRVQAFNDTRAKFATIDTGLAHWIQVTVHSHPEHADVVDKSAKLATGAVPPQLGAGAGAGVTRKKFPKLSSLGNFGSSSQLDVSAGGGAPSGSGISAGGHARRPSAPLGAMMNKQQVEQRGKELLHSAGVLGGRAGEAAKGLFARGRSKLKGGGIGGHSEKGFQAFRGYRSPLPLTELEQNAAALDLMTTTTTATTTTTTPGTNRKRHTVHFGSLPPAPKPAYPYPGIRIQRKWRVKRKEMPGEGAGRRGGAAAAGVDGSEAEAMAHPGVSSPRLAGDDDTQAASKIQFTINGAPMGSSPAAGAGDRRHTAGIEAESTIASGGAREDTENTTLEEMFRSWTTTTTGMVSFPRFGEYGHGHEDNRGSVSSLGVALDEAAAPRNAHAASSSVSLPSSLGAGGMDTTGIGVLDTRSLSLTPSRFTGHCHKDSQVSSRSIDSCPPSQMPTLAPPAPTYCERNDRASSESSMPQATPAAMKIKYAGELHDHPRVSNGASNPEDRLSAPYKKKAFGRLTGLLRPSRPRAITPKLS